MRIQKQLKGAVMTNGKLNWWAGAPIGVGAHFLSKAVTAKVAESSSSDMVTRMFDASYKQAIPGLVIDALLVAFKSTRTAGLTALGAGVVLMVVDAARGV